MLYPHIQNMAVFDLESIQYLDLMGSSGLTALQEGVASIGSLMITSPPIRLVELKLSRVVVDYSTLQTCLPFCLPNLTKLELEEMALRGPLRQYFEFPKLKDLTLIFVYYAPLHTDIHDLVPPLFDRLFFQGTPKLEMLHIGDMFTMDEPLVGSLHLCSYLQNLTIKGSDLEEFISSFCVAIQDRKLFPSLAQVSIDDSWPVNAGMSYVEFIEHSQAERPGLDIQGNGRLYL
jgi:hypothetical protein